MLRGNALAKLDGKGRVKLPSAFRAIIEPRYGSDFFVTSLRGESVLLYPMEVWQRVEDRMTAASRFKPAVMRFRKRANYYGQTATMDSQGRILIHPLLRERAGIDGEVAVLGQQDHLELWNRGVFEERLEAEPLTDEDLESLAELGIG